jgi:hypothetical protein
MKTPHEIHWKATKRILRYVGVQFSSRYITVQGGLLYWLVSLIQIGFGDPDDQNSTAGYVFILGSGPVTWACKKQQAISLSSVEAEYRATINASQEALWL